MNICSEDHQEICYMGHGCPLCDLKFRIGRLEEELADCEDAAREAAEAAERDGQ